MPCGWLLAGRRAESLTALWIRMGCVGTSVPGARCGARWDNEDIMAARRESMDGQERTAVSAPLLRDIAAYLQNPDAPRGKRYTMPYAQKMLADAWARVRRTNPELSHAAAQAGAIASRYSRGLQKQWQPDSGRRPTLEEFIAALNTCADMMTEDATVYQLTYDPGGVRAHEAGATEQRTQFPEADGRDPSAKREGDEPRDWRRWVKHEMYPEIKRRYPDPGAWERFLVEYGDALGGDADALALLTKKRQAMKRSAQLPVRKDGEDDAAYGARAASAWQQQMRVFTTDTKESPFPFSVDALEKMFGSGDTAGSTRAQSGESVAVETDHDAVPADSSVEGEELEDGLLGGSGNDTLAAAAAPDTPVGAEAAPEVDIPPTAEPGTPADDRVESVAEPVPAESAEPAEPDADAAAAQEAARLRAEIVRIDQEIVRVRAEGDAAEADARDFLARAGRDTAREDSRDPSPEPAPVEESAEHPPESSLHAQRSFLRDFGTGFADASVGLIYAAGAFIGWTYRELFMPTLNAFVGAIAGDQKHPWQTLWKKMKGLVPSFSLKGGGGHGGGHDHGHAHGGGHH